MTILFCLNNIAYVDRLQSHGDTQRETTKVHRLGDVTYACAGDPDFADMIMTSLDRNGDWFSPITVQPAAERKNDVIVARINSVLYRLSFTACDQPRFSPIRQPEGGLPSEIAGSAWAMFQAYFLEHRDVHVAYELVRKYSSTVGGALEQF